MLDMSMRASLAESLAHIHSVAAKQICCIDVDVANLSSEIRSHRIRPGLFGRYYDLVLAVRGRRYDEAKTLFREIVELASERPILTTLPFTEGALGAEKALYARLIGAEPKSPALAAPDSDQWPAFEENVVAALNLIEEADVALATELRALVIQIIGAAPSTHNGGRGFGGISSFMLWGATFSSTWSSTRTQLDLVEGLVHAPSFVVRASRLTSHWSTTPSRTLLAVGEATRGLWMESSTRPLFAPHTMLTSGSEKRRQSRLPGSGPAPYRPTTA